MAVPERIAECDAERDQHGDEHEEQAVQRPFERRPRVPKRARLAGQSRRIALLADGGDEVRAGSFDRKRAGAHVLSLRPFDGARLAGQDRLVEPQRVGLLERPVRDDLVSRPDLHEVADDDLLDLNLPRRSVANDGCVWRDEGRQPVERPFRPDLLHRSDPGVPDEDTEEERVLPLAERQGEAAGDGEDQVEDREDVGADDARVRTARARARRRASLGKAA